MQESNLERKYDYYARVIEEGKKSTHSPRYQAVCSTLADLIDLSSNHDHQSKMTPKEHSDLMEKYQAVQIACNAYLNPPDKFSGFELDRKKIIEDISKVLTNDVKVLSTYDRQNPKSFAAMLTQARTHTMVLNTKDINTVGAALSSRIPVELPDGKKGFFTKATTYNIDEKWEKSVREFMEKFDQYLSPVGSGNLEKLINNTKVQEEFYAKCPAMKLALLKQIYGKNGEKYAQNAIISVAQFLDLGMNEKGVRRSLSEQPELSKLIREFIDTMGPMLNQRGIMKVAGIKKGANISSRNCAMTDMANLLGCGNILAESRPMEIELDGKKVKGVFMETVEGTDLERIHKDDLVLKAREDSFDKTIALRQVIDLQVLDFICGNVDRHGGNMIYNFEYTSKNKVVFKGIKGIDNDCSLGTPQIVENKPIMRMVNPENMQYISASMWAILESLDRNQIHLKLQHHITNGDLSEAEVDAVWDRAKKVQDAVHGKKIAVVPDNFWKENNLSDLAVNKGTYLHGIKTMQRTCQNEGYKREIKENAGVNYIRDNISDEKLLRGKEAKLLEIQAMMKEAKAMFYNSEEYELMESNFNTVLSLTQSMNRGYKEGKVPEDRLNKVKAAYIDLAEKTETYIGLKKLVPFQTRGKKRLEIANMLADFANETMDGMSLDRNRKAELLKEEPEDVNILETGDDGLENEM